MAAASCLSITDGDVRDEDRVIYNSTKAPEGDAAAEGEASGNESVLLNGWRYWTVIAALSVTALLPAMEGTVVSTALPSIVQDLHGGGLYVWVVNSYFLTRLGSQVSITSGVLILEADRVNTFKHCLPAVVRTDRQYLRQALSCVIRNFFLHAW